MAAKRKKKTLETIIMIRLPDVDARQGVGTLTIQRGELGHIGEFDYKGLTLKGNIAEAVQAALLKLAKVEAAPPPDLAPESAPTVSSQLTQESATDDDESVSSDSLPDDAEEDESPSESAKNTENPPETAQNLSVSNQTAIADTDDSSPNQPPEIAAKPPQKVSVSVVAELSAKPPGNQQIALF